MENNDYNLDTDLNDVTEDTFDEDTKEHAEEKSPRELELEADLAKYKRMADQKNKKLEKLENGSLNKESSKAKDGFDYGEKAFLIANGIKGSDEIEIVQRAMKLGDMTLEEAIDDEYVQSKIKKAREHRASENAMPNNTNRTGNSTRNEVDYWIAKGELPPKENVELRRKVVNERLKKSGNVQKFAN